MAGSPDDAFHVLIVQYANDRYRLPRLALLQARGEGLGRGGVVGNIEYSTYPEGSDYCPFGIKVDKFDLHLQPAFRNELLTIYSVPEFLQE